MKATVNIGNGTGGERMILRDNIPLDTPMGIYIFPIYSCNFKCKYCLNSLDKREYRYSLNSNVMSMSLFKKCVDDMKKFKRKIKMVRFAGLGEPLLHKDIVNMVKYVQDSNVADMTEIITNGSLLTERISNELIEANLGRLSISIQGIDEKMYKSMCDYNLNYSEYISNIKYFYEHKGNSKLHIKILDCSIPSEDERKSFFDIFGQICDTITVEKVQPLMEKVDYSIFDCGDKTVRGAVLEDNDICSFPFYLMQINPDGSVIPCCSIQDNSIIVGDCNNESLSEIWNGENFNKFRKNILKGCSSMDEKYACRRCNAYKYVLFPEDRISAEDSNRLINLF